MTVKLYNKQHNFSIQSANLSNKLPCEEYLLALFWYQIPNKYKHQKLKRNYNLILIILMFKKQNHCIFIIQLKQLLEENKIKAQ